MDKYKTWYSQEKLKEIAKIAEEKGTYEEVASYIGISVNKLYEKRKKNPKLEEILTESFEKYHANNISLKNYVFTEVELEEITATVRDSNIEMASSKYGVSAQVFHGLRRNNPGLDKAIIKGQEERKSNSLLNQALAMFRKLDDAASLNNITDIVLNGGVEALEEYYKVSPHILRRCRKEIPNLEISIKKALKQRPAGAAIPSIQAKITKTKSEKKERKSSKPYNKKGFTRKPPREIIDKTLSGIADKTDTALTNFRKLMQERKQLENIKRIRDGDFNNIV